MKPTELVRKIIKLNLVLKLYSRKSLAEKEMYFGQLHILDFIKDNQSCTQIEIAEYLNVSAASIALSTKRLERGGFIIKATDENNLRCKRLTLTEKGENVRADCKNILDFQDEKMFSGFTEDELILLSNLLDRATINLTEENENVVSRYTFRDLEKQIEQLQVSHDE